MKTIIAALAGASLLTLAGPAAAQSRHDHDSWSHGSSGGANGGGWTRGGSSSAGSPGFAPGAGPRAISPGLAPGGGPHSGSPIGGVPRGGFAGPRGFDGHRDSDGDHDHHHFHGFPVFLGGFGFGLGLAAFDPWFFDGPYYGYWEPYPYYAYGYAPYAPPPAYYPPPPRPEAAPAPPTAQEPAACGAWAWDSVKQVYNWVPCGA